MATEHDDVEFEGNIEQTSAKAFLFQADFWDKPEWIPKSQCDMVPMPDSDTQGRCTMYIRRWLAKKNKWVDE